MAVTMTNTHAVVWKAELEELIQLPEEAELFALVSPYELPRRLPPLLADKARDRDLEVS
jgi:hypothetical protein